MRILQFRARGVSKVQLKRVQRTDPSSGLPSSDRSLITPAMGTILAGVVVVVLVAHSTGSPNRNVLDVMQQAGIDMMQARLAVDLAESTNARGAVLLPEALDKAQAIKAALASDPPQAFSVGGIYCRVVSGTIAAEIRPAIPNITIQLTVSAVDGFYSSVAGQTDSEGKVSFQWPSGEKTGDFGNVSVTALLSGVTATSGFEWVRQATPWDFSSSSK